MLRPYKPIDILGLYIDAKDTIAHNGTIFEGDILTDYFHRQKGETDSERILLFMLDRLNDLIRQKGRPLDEDERFSVLEEMTKDLSPHNKLNLLIYDGDILYVHISILQRRAGTKKRCQPRRGIHP